MSQEALAQQIQPQGEVETLTFNRYLHAIAQIERFRQFETEAQDRWQNEPANPIWFHQMERIQKLAALHERRADQALKELRKLQADRFSSMDVHNEMYLLGKRADIPVTLPVRDLRRDKPTPTTAFAVASMILTNTPEVWSIIENHSSPQPSPPEMGKGSFSTGSTALPSGLVKKEY